MEKLYVVVTMDVERPTSFTRPEATGPTNWEDSERYILGYVERAAEFGFPVTFFIHPEAAVEHARLFAELKKDGCCVDGLHVHPWKLGDGKYKAHVGGLTESELRACLAEATATWQSGMARRPVYFRPGTFSGNDWMYPVLVDLGFRGGSCSIPGRTWPRMNVNWVGAEPDPHRPHPTFRHIVGNLPFAEMPISVDFSKRIVSSGAKWNAAGDHEHSLEANTAEFHPDMRPDLPDMDYFKIASNIIGQIEARNAAVPVINFVTHNDNDYTDPTDRVRVNLERSLQAIRDAAEAADVEPVGATMDTIADLVLDEPDHTLEFVYT